VSEKNSKIRFQATSATMLTTTTTISNTTMIPWRRALRSMAKIRLRALVAEARVQTRSSLLAKEELEA
jgi:hypothetical protein